MGHGGANGGSKGNIRVEFGVGPLNKKPRRMRVPDTVFDNPQGMFRNPVSARPLVNRLMAKSVEIARSLLPHWNQQDAVCNSLDVMHGQRRFVGLQKVAVVGRNDKPGCAPHHGIRAKPTLQRTFALLDELSDILRASVAPEVFRNLLIREDQRTTHDGIIPIGLPSNGLFQG